VNLRYLVPALGIIAVSIPLANAEDKSSMPVISFDGWVNTTLEGSSANYPTNDPATAKDEKGVELGFENEASLKTYIKLGDSVSGKINIFIDPGNDAVLNVREAYVDWKLNTDWTLQTGKYFTTIGWISPEPTGLYTVNNSLIGYLGAYGNDPIGASLAFGHANCPLSGALHITNGSYNGADAYSVTPDGATGGGTNKSPSRGNADLGYGLDLTYTLPGNDRNFVNFDFDFDPHGAFFGYYTVGVALGTVAFGGPADAEGGRAVLLDLNAQYVVAKGLLVAAEIANLNIGDDHPGAGTVANAAGVGGNRTQGLVLANYELPKASTVCPMSVTGEVQYITDKAHGASNNEKASEETLALLTNPTGSDFFALNAELSFTQYTSPITGVSKVNAVVVSLQSLLSF
jgi:hypothetical protein